MSSIVSPPPHTNSFVIGIALINTHSFTIPLPPREHIYNRYCSNKHTQFQGRLRFLCDARPVSTSRLPSEGVAYAICPRYTEPHGTVVFPFRTRIVMRSVWSSHRLLSSEISRPSSARVSTRSLVGSPRCDFSLIRKVASSSPCCVIAQ
jgi:hypothetical protein